MKKIEITLYEFSELSEEAQNKAIEKLYDINIGHDWWEFTYEDAKNIGLKITSFDLDRNRHATGDFIESGLNVAESIIKEHGESTNTHKTALQYISNLKELTEKLNSAEIYGEENYGIQAKIEGEIEESEQEFLSDLLEDYSIILQRESEYLQSRESIIETIEANEYDFTEDGKIY